MSRLNDLLNIVTANSEENIDDFLELLKPDNKSTEEMGSIYEETIGYDPITYFDKVSLNNMIDIIKDLPETPEAVVEALDDSRTEIIESAFNIFNENKIDTFLPAALEEAIEEITGVSIDIEFNVSDEDDDYDMDEEIDEEEEIDE